MEEFDDGKKTENRMKNDSEDSKIKDKMKARREEKKGVKNSGRGGKNEEI